MPEYPDDENGDVLRSLEIDGDDLSKPRDINFSLVFDDESSAREFIRTVQIDDAQIELSDHGGGESMWDVTITYHMVPTHRDITAIERHLERLVSPLGGRNDGWGCFSVRSS
jgi:hypothetical protein